jgi:hypothetical protein
MDHRLDYLAANLRPWVGCSAAKYVDAAVAGDADAAFSLTISLPNEQRGALAVAFWESGVAREAFRAVLASVWDHDHAHLIRAARTRPRLRAMFRDAAFPLPALPDNVTAWRGTNGISRSRAARGMAWTLDRDTACWFAMRFASFKGRPMVLQADIPSSSVALYHDEGGEREIVVFNVHDAVIDGSEEDWREGAQRRHAATAAKQEALLASHVRKEAAAWPSGAK